MKSNNCNALSPARQSLTRLPRPSGQGNELVGSVSVARVRPRTSKGITACLHKVPVEARSPLENFRDQAAAVAAAPLTPWPVGPYCKGLVTQGISTYLKPPICGPPLSARCDGSALPELATGLANSPSFQKGPASPVPGGVAHAHASSENLRLFPTVRGLPPKRLERWTSSYL